jgi:hypothetical protein
MGSQRNGVRGSDAKRNWTEREWELYGNLPWLVQKLVDLLMGVPRFVRSAPAREIRIIDRRLQYVERRLLEAKRRRRAS